MKCDKRIRLGLIGCGTIGTVIAKAVAERFAPSVKLNGICDEDKDRAAALRESLSMDVPVVRLGRLIKTNDIIVEAASPTVVPEVVRRAVLAGKDVMVMSSGGLLGHTDIFEKASRKGVRIYVPSGALCGLDGVKSASMAGVSSVTLTTRKPPKGLEGAPYIVRNKIDLSMIDGEVVIFDGTAEDAVKAFPKNINVSATLSLCGVGAKDTRVRIITSPKYKDNVHEVEVIGVFGRLVARTENVPSPNNPRTSYLAALSAVAMIENIISGKRIGN